MYIPSITISLEVTNSRALMSPLDLDEGPEKLHSVMRENKKLIRRWDSERELSSRRHRTCTTKYKRLLHEYRHSSTRLCVGTQVYRSRWNNAMQRPLRRSRSFKIINFG